MSATQKQAEAGKLRIDKWLWAARFFKTRSLAIAAIEAGKVEVNETRVKPAKTIDISDLVAIRLGPYQFVVEVLALSDKRGPAPQAQKLYKETDESAKRREELAFQRKAQAQNETREGRPTKKERRDFDKFESGAWE